MLDRRGRLLVAALGFVGLRVTSYDLALHALRSWLDSWPGIGAVAGGMAHQGYDLQLTRYDEQGWRATFYTSGMEHSPTSATGTAWEPTPWRAVQLAAWEASIHEGGSLNTHPVSAPLNVMFDNEQDADAYAVEMAKKWIDDKG